ncbi:hypothetical protein FNH13_15760 [Ornithinimicrobium ciconiae]|uniref:Uncharacterized protein n=1 Tax=Ornithinimicrobium ciconiae TaxID=2594265 RepID=A0A516GDN3_9MICO|nr:hypothetical protein [Ornithinimicrobium ciconiae]QDO89607.1 hypothetical protein FNH13_15760 [Ornithinimicrobium ciconiae]
MGTFLLVLAAVFLLVGAAAAFLAARLSSKAGDPRVAERRRRLVARLAVPSFLIGFVLIVLSCFV